jgi:CRISPR-associated exonuclease Cas4
VGYLIVGLLLIGLWLLRTANRRQVASGLPPGKVVYLDTEHLGRLERTLYDPDLDLSGRPDYIVEMSNELVPVEIKSGRAPAYPYPSHVMQLATYCKLVHSAFGVRPSCGIVKYADRAFAVNFTSKVENDLMDLISRMRQARRLAPGRSHDSHSRCQACGYFDICDKVLG